MKIVYDAEVDALRISLFDGKAIESEEVLPDVILDYTEDGKVVSIEVLNASKHIEELNGLEKLVHTR